MPTIHNPRRTVHGRHVTTLCEVEDVVAQGSLEGSIEVEAFPVSTKSQTEGYIGSTLTDLRTVTGVDGAITVEINETYVTRLCIRLDQTTVGILIAIHLIPVLEDTVCLQTIEIRPYITVLGMDVSTDTTSTSTFVVSLARLVTKVDHLVLQNRDVTIDIVIEVLHVVFPTELKLITPVLHLSEVTHR